MLIICAHCGNQADFPAGKVNRAKKVGLKLFCSRVCFGLSRRANKSTEQKKLEKYEYDKKYRAVHAERRQTTIKAYNESPAGRAMQKRNREKFKQNHLEYCRTPEYRLYKKEYDQVHRAKNLYGEFFEAAIILNKIDLLILPEKKEAKIQKGTYNKSQKRKRLWNSLQKI